MRILYQGLLSSAASWARVGRGFAGAFLDLGHEVAAVRARGFGYDPAIGMPSGLSVISSTQARAAEPYDLGLGFLHPPLLERLLGKRRFNLFVWESDRIPAEWVKPLAAGCDRVIVPSRFTREALAASGVPGERIAVVPFGFDPSLAKRAVELRTVRAQNNDRALRARNDDRALRAQAPFTILSVAAPHWRKGVRELLSAYRQAFSAADQTLLRIKTTYDPAARKKRFPFEIPSWEGLIAAAGLRDPGAPAVEVNGETILLDAKMASLYAEADLYAAPSWGESFGLGILDALAAGVPVVATNWGGHTEYMHASNDLLPFRLEPGGDRLYQSAPGAQVAIPDVEALAARLRWHYEHRAELQPPPRLTWAMAAAELLRNAAAYAPE